MKTLEGYSLSNQQKRVWKLMHTFNAPFYNYLSLNIEGDLSMPKLTKCFITVCNRHESLRTRFEKVKGMEYPIQSISEKGSFSFSYSCSDEDLDEENPKQAADMVLNKFMNNDDEKVIHIDIKKINDLHHVLNIFGSSLSTDFQSLQLIVEQTLELYMTNQLVSKEEIVQYVDFSEWQNELFQDEHEINWKSSMSQRVLPFEQLNEQSNIYRNKNIRKTVSKELSGRVRHFAKRSKLPVSTVFLKVWATYLSKLASQELTIGLIVDGRNYEELIPSVGQFEKIIPIQQEQADSTFLEGTELLQLQLTRLTEKLEYINPITLFPHGENYIPYQMRYIEDEVPNLTSPIKIGLKNLISNSEKHKLLLSILSKPEEFEIFLQFNEENYLNEDINDIIKGFIYFVEECLNNSSERISTIPFLSPEEEKDIINQLNEYGRSQPDSNDTILAAFKERIVMKENLAITTSKESITYQDLDRRSNQLANYLKPSIQPEDRIAICMPRSIESIISMIAILKIGAAFIPIDIKWPFNRIQYVIEDSNARLILSNKNQFRNGTEEIALKTIDLSLIEQDIENASETPPEIDVLTNQLAYVLYTSGSTGIPKGVGVQHNNLLNYLKWFDQQFSRDTVRLPFISELGFDAFIKQVFYPLMAGKNITLFSEEEVLHLPQFLNNFLDNQLNSLNCVPSLWKSLLEEIQKDDAIVEKMKAKLEVLFIGGEKTSSSLLINTWKIFPDLKIVNLYGPTETTSNATYAIVKNELCVPIGRPIQHTTTYVLNKDMKETKIGEFGELFIGGEGVSRGYLDKPSLTAEQFLPNPFMSGTRLYRTGDMVKLLSNGQIEFIQRMDEQIKINGKRVDVSEIETIITSHPKIIEAVVLSVQKLDRNLLAVFYVGTCREDEIKMHTKNWLPQYMVPSHFINVDQFPLNTNGKIDHKALKKLLENNKINNLIAPRNGFEEVILSVWKDVLKIERVGIRDNFFELGGHSLNATQIISRIRKIYQLEIPVSLVFETETTETLCNEIKIRYPNECNYIDLVSNAYLEAERLVIDNQ